MTQDKEHNKEEVDDTILSDNRILATGTLAKDFVSPAGVFHSAGTSIVITGMVKFDKKILSFSLPNSSELFLHQSKSLWETSQEHFDNKNNFRKSESPHLPGNFIHPRNTSDFFDAIEGRMSAIVFAYTAIESYVNASIPNDYIFRRISQGNKFTEEYTKEQIERNLSLGIKLSEVLHHALETSSVKNQNFWREFNEIEKLRNRIIHTKSIDTKSSQAGSDTLWEHVLNTKLKNPVNTTIEIFNFLNKYKKLKTP